VTFNPNQDPNQDHTASPADIRRHRVDNSQAALACGSLPG
jgi:hypothetical protein